MRKLSTIAILGTLVASAVAGAGWWQFNAVVPLQEPVIVLVPRGTRSTEVGKLLQREQVVAEPYSFTGLLLALRKERRIQAGEYQFAPGMRVRDVLAVLLEGHVYHRRVTIPEGWSTVQILSAVKAADGLEGEAPATYKEGELLPETYFYTRGETRAAVLERMHTAMKQAVAEAWAGKAADVPLKSPEEMVTLASIVEAETPKAVERPKVAGVYLNRIRQGMKLQADPTVEYGLTLGKPMERMLTYADLEKPTPYNTYVIEGLPPGPIGNPGKASLRAAAAPETTNAVYFVADGTGGHVFARTYEEHLRNVAAWRAVQRNR